MAKYNEEFLRKVAYGDKEALEMVASLPTTARIGIAYAVDELRRKENIIPMNNSLNLYVQDKKTQSDQDAIGEAYAKHLQKIKDNEAENERKRQEYLEKVAKQRAERARALGSWQ